MNFLLIEDDPKIAEIIRQGMEKAGIAVENSDNGRHALERVTCSRYDMIVLDLMLPEMDGFSFLEEVRRRGIKTPVIILSARPSTEDRIRGLQSGADDYLVKPFSFEELMVRIQTILRRTQSSDESPRLLQGEDVVVNLLTREVRRGGKKIDLQSREYSLLVYLMQNPGRILTKALILEKIWDYRFDPQTNIVDVLVFRLRSKIDKDFDTKLIHTLRGLGYVFGRR